MSQNPSKPAKVNKPKSIPQENEYRGFQVKFNDLKQRHVEKWHELMEVDPHFKDAGLPIRNSIIVRAAFKAGWFELPIVAFTPEADPLMDWPPDRVNWLANLITDKYLEVMYIDPT